MDVEFEYGDGALTASLPDDAVVVRPETATHEPPPLEDPVAATRAALASPLGSEPIRGLVSAGSTVTIAFPDRVKGGTQETAHRKTSMRLLLEELDQAGVRREDIRLVCAIGLHRKNRHDEFVDYLGRDVVESVPAANLVNHDAEDPQGMVDLGTSELGDPVAMNKALAESDLTILIGHTAGNPYGGFSGGYKMPSTGLTSWRSIASHHAPRSLYRDDFVPASTGSRFREQLTAIGQRMQEAMPQPFFSIDAVLDSRSRQLGVYAGSIPEVEKASWPLATARTDLQVPGEPAEVLVIGVPRNFHYGAGMGSNPILMMQAIGASVVRAKKALVEKPVVIAAAVCDGWFNDSEFPPYREAYERLQSCQHPADMAAHQEAMATDPEWVYQYRHQFGYHPFHAFSMIYMGGIAREHSSAIYVAGARNPGLARGMGARTTATVEEALAETTAILGHTPRVLAVPRLSQPAFHLTSERA
ncbi:lactate racemase domain-containing protein [Nocardioides nanhaiensis]|uniref:Lactate racemase domain-containing protein n=1 Tax=Nocardioides nanhaiensis TaxID=1476871 RepID=A0ABP8VWT5_9ACTN